MRTNRAVWVFTDPNAICDVLLRSNDFRIATRSEFVPTRSTSFFLSADIFGPDRGKELKHILVDFFGVEGMNRLRPRIRAAVESAQSRRPNLDFVQVACRRAFCAVLGLCEADALPIIALCKVAALQQGTEVSNASLRLARERVELLLTEKASELDGFITWLTARDGLTDTERLLLIYPFFEMLSLGQHEVLARAAVQSSAATATERVKVATTMMEGVVITRVAVGPQTVLGQKIGSGDRVLLDVTASNQKTPTPHLCFGIGQHSCVGRLLALEIAAVVAEQSSHVL